MAAREYNFSIDDHEFTTADQTLTGRQLRDAASLAPASGYVLIQIADQTGRSIGLEDSIKLSRSEIKKFRAFESDRIFTFTFNERGWEWGARKINEAELRELAGISEGYVLILDSDRDREIQPGEEINLGSAGVEHIRTERAKKVKIKVNGRDQEIEADSISFEHLVELADLAAQPGPNMYYTITYRRGPRVNPEGSMQPGEFVRIKNGMVFNVRATDKS